MQFLQEGNMHIPDATHAPPLQSAAPPRTGRGNEVSTWMGRKRSASERHRWTGNAGAADHRYECTTRVMLYETYQVAGLRAQLT